jgi:apolipoprotein N-acyltransferase
MQSPVSPRWWKLPLLSGVLLGVAYLPGPFLAFNLSAFVPLLWWLESNRDASAFRRLSAGFVFGWVVHLISLHFTYAMLEQSWLAALLYLGFSVALGVRIALSIALLGWLRKRSGLSLVVLLPMVWVSFEWIQGLLPDLRMTGDHLAHTVAGYPFLVQFADLIGPYGVTAVLLAINGLLCEVLTKWGRPVGRRPREVLVVLLAAVLAYDLWAWNRPEPPHRTLRVALVQPNISLAVKHDAESRAEQRQKLTELSRRAASQGAELILWPESARPGPLYHWVDRPETYAMSDVSALARSLGVPILTGVEYARVRGSDDYDLFNAAMGVDRDGRLLEEWGAKTYLVPFVEATPFRSVFGPLVEGRGGQWRWLAGGFLPGPDSIVLPIAGTRVGVLVCYEQLFPDLARNLRSSGAELQVVITNDAWFGRTVFQTYQANAVRLRAIENRTAFVRVANTGISGFIDRRGRYHQKTRLFEEAVEVRDVHLSTQPTVYSRTGDVVAWSALTLTVAATLPIRRRRRSR